VGCPFGAGLSIAGMRIPTPKGVVGFVNAWTVNDVFDRVFDLTCGYAAERV
jgi:hypothetical protein